MQCSYFRELPEGSWKFWEFCREAMVHEVIDGSHASSPVEAENIFHTIYRSVNVKAHLPEIHCQTFNQRQIYCPSHQRAQRECGTASKHAKSKHPRCCPGNLQNTFACSFASHPGRSAVTHEILGSSMWGLCLAINWNK